jgi:peptidoglycan/LPS O-acetylase OafA/YrhL
MSGINYRPDVDGLRAVAVLLVLLFHARIGCPGGYVGVDVFFVISGYLITGLILKQQRAGTFRLRDFWHRRIRRIVPASSVMVFATLAAGCVLFPSDYDELAESALAQQLMLSNVYFWRNTGYFAGPADLKPLLHTWSLAVEEQFYVLYPFLLLLLGRLSPRHASRVLIGATLASFVLSEWGVRNFPSATFFLLPTRAWELLLGGLLCFTRPLGDSRRWLSLFVGVAGLCAVVVSASCFDENTQFPGTAALLPCVGAAMCIYSNSGTPNLAGRLLSLKPVVFVGLISYSLYLWHWPVLALSRYRFGEHLNRAEAVAALGVSFVLAWISWRFVERPLRCGTHTGARLRTLWGVCATVPVLIVCASLVMHFDGFPARASQDVLRYRAAQDSQGFLDEVQVDQVRSRELPRFGAAQGPRKCLIWGDSHAMSLVPGLDAACKSRGICGLQATHSSTPPLLDFVRSSQYGLDEKSPEYNRAVIELIQSEAVDVVVLSSAGALTRITRRSRPACGRRWMRLWKLAPASSLCSTWPLSRRTCRWRWPGERSTSRQQKSACRWTSIGVEIESVTRSSSMLRTAGR